MKDKKQNEKYVTDKTFKTSFNGLETKFTGLETRFDKFEERFESSARATAKSFSDQAEILAIILKEIKTNNEDNKYFRQSISDLYGGNLSRDRKIEDLSIRVGKLENAN